MEKNSKKTSLSTISAKISAEAKADLEDRAQQRGMIKSDYLRFIIEQSSIGLNQSNEVISTSQNSTSIVSEYDFNSQNQVITNQLQEIIEKQNIILNNTCAIKKKIFSNIMLGVAILSICCICILKE